MTLMKPKSRRPLWRLILVAAVTAALFAEATTAQRVELAPPSNFDIRTEKTQANAAYRARVMGGAAQAVASRVSARRQGLSKLRASFNGLNVIQNRALGNPEVVSVKPGMG